jgi:predicted outer membrane repeat protein
LQIEVLEDRLAPAQLTVTSALDPASLTTGTLRYAVNQANTDATAGIADTIKFNTAQMGTRTIMLQKGLLELKPGTGTITIDGGDSVAISGNNASSIFQADSGVRVALKGLTLEKGKAAAGGGGIFNAGSMALSNVSLSGNSAPFGGAIYNAGNLLVSNTTLSGNSALHGGGIDNSGMLRVSDATLSANSATFDGGAGQLRRAHPDHGPAAR